MRTFFPEIKLYKEFTLPVDDTHTLAVSEYGNPKGIPVIVNHGGPGSGCRPKYAQYFDPDKYRIVLYDQRGAGQSKPTASLKDNTTDHLVNDLEFLRKHLGIDKIVVFGGSWGATLSILYAERFPNHVLSIILRGIYLGRSQDTRAFLTEDSKAAKSNPEEWVKLKAHVFPDDEKEEKSFEVISKAYLDKVTQEDPAIWKPAAKAFARWECVNSCQDPEEQKKKIAWAEESDDAANMGRIEVYYLSNNCFLKENYIIDNFKNLPKVPIYITTGQQDFICPPEQTKTLVEKLLSLGHTQVVAQYPANTGHSPYDPGNVDALICFTDNFANYYLKSSANTDEKQSIPPKPATYSPTLLKPSTTSVASKNAGPVDEKSNNDDATEAANQGNASPSITFTG